MDTALVTLDCIGMQCPAPILAISKAAKTARRPALIEVRADDSDFAGDVRAWCRSTGATLQSLEEVGGTFVARIGLGDPLKSPLTAPRLEGAVAGVPLAAAGPSGPRPDIGPPPRGWSAAGASAPPQAPHTPSGPARRTATGHFTETPAPRAPALRGAEAPRPDRGEGAAAMAASTNRPEPQASQTVGASPAPAHSAAGHPARLELDCRGMRCPAPILEVTRASRNLTAPTILTIRADDPDFPPDLTAWCRATGAQLFGMEEAGEVYTATLGVNGARPVSDKPPTASVDLRGQAAEIALLQLGQRVMAGAPVGFTADPGPLERHLKAWAQVVGANVEVRREGAVLRGQVQLDTRDMPALRQPQTAIANAAPRAQMAQEPQPVNADGGPARQSNKCTLLLLHNDFEPLMASLMTANACAAQGMEVEMYFMFWGINVLRSPYVKAAVVAERTPFLKKMMKWMMPAGPEAVQMSKMNMGGMGVEMMKFFIKKENVMTIRALMNNAIDQNVKFVACSTSMGIMGIQKHDLMDLPNISFGGVTGFSSSARESAMSLVF